MSASHSAESSTICARATFTTIAPSLSIASCSAPIIPWVDATPGADNTRTSQPARESFNRSGPTTRSTKDARGLSAWRRTPVTTIPNACARFATSIPIVPSPTIVIRALGPSLVAFGVSDPLPDPTLTVYDANGAAIATNNDWQDEVNALDLSKNELVPSDPLEAATILFLPAGSYTTIVSGVAGGTGVGLVEVYDL